MAITQSQAAVAVTGAISIPQRASEAAWAGDAAVQYLLMAVAIVPVVPGVATVGQTISAFPLLPSAIAGMAGLPKNSIVTGTPFVVRGRPFGNRPLSDYQASWGATVTAASGDQKLYVVDFHGLRAIRNVTVTGDASLKIRSWEGVRFPVDNDGAPRYIPLMAGQAIDLLTQKIEITLSQPLSQADFEAKTHIDCLSYPSNVRFVIAQGAPSLGADGKPRPPIIRDENGALFALTPIPFAQATGKEPIFWTYNGDLAGQVALPDFSRELNDFLESAPAQGGLCFPHLIAYSDTPGFLEIVESGGSPFVALRYLTAIQFDEDDPLVTTVRCARHGDEQNVEMVLFRRTGDQFVTPAGVDAAAPRVRIHKVQWEMSGAMDGDRLDPDVHWEQRVIAASARASAVFSVAQPLRPTAMRQVIGVDLCLSATADADLVLELQADAGGAPDGVALAAAPIDVTTVVAAPGWTSARFAQAVEIPGGQTTWAVVKVRAGSALWLADASIPGGDVSRCLRYSRDGAFWTLHEPPLVGLHKLKILLPVAERSAPLVARLLTRTGIALQPTASPQTAVILFDPPADLAGDKIALHLTPEAAGEVKLSSVMVEYVPMPTEK